MCHVRMKFDCKLYQQRLVCRRGINFVNFFFNWMQDAAALVSRRKAERRTRTPHVFPPSPLPGPALLSNDFVSSPTCVAWSPCFDNSPCKDLGYQAGPGGLKALSISLLGDVASSEGTPWASEQQQPLNQLAKNYLQTVQELKQSRFSYGHETTLEPEHLSPRYRELKAGFWKRLATNSRCGSHTEEPCDSAIGRESEFPGRLRSSHPTTGCKRAARGGPLDRWLNGSVEIEVVLTGKRNGSLLDEAAAAAKPEQDAAHVQNEASNPCETATVEHFQKVDVPVRDEIDQSPSATAAQRDHDDDVCRTGASSREDSEGESLNGEIMVPSCDENPLQRQEQRQQDGSECSFGSGGGIGRGRIGEDGSPTSTSSHRQVRLQISLADLFS